MWCDTSDRTEGSYGETTKPILKWHGRHSRTSFTYKIHDSLNGYNHLVQTIGDYSMQSQLNREMFYILVLFWLYFGGRTGEHYNQAPVASSTFGVKTSRGGFLNVNPSVLRSRASVQLQTWFNLTALLKESSRWNLISKHLFFFFFTSLVVKIKVMCNSSTPPCVSVKFSFHAHRSTKSRNMINWRDVSSF